MREGGREGGRGIKSEFLCYIHVHVPYVTYICCSLSLFSLRHVGGKTLRVPSKMVRLCVVLMCVRMFVCVHDDLIFVIMYIRTYVHVCI